MISHLKGTVEKIADNSLIIDVNGVGYSVLCSSRTIASANDRSQTIKIFTTLIVREDAWTLYGFSSENEQFWFNKLTSVQGVGGKAALSILSALSDEDIYNAFLSEDKNMFVRADGVGNKIAARIISELKDKIVGKIETHLSATQALEENSMTQDVVSALTNLGYQRGDIYKAMGNIDINENDHFDSIFKKALNKLSSGD